MVYLFQMTKYNLYLSTIPKSNRKWHKPSDYTDESHSSGLTFTREMCLIGMYSDSHVFIHIHSTPWGINVARIKSIPFIDSTLYLLIVSSFLCIDPLSISLYLILPGMGE